MTALGNATYFASGSNLPGEIRGLSEINHPLGVAVQEVSELALEELERLAGTGLRVFVDSGAFSEVNHCLEVTNPMSDADWRERLEVYKRLAKALGAQLFVVAPDRVGCQQTTLERLETYRAEVREVAALGANVLLPLQRGELSPAEFLAFAKEVTGLDDALVPAFPMKKGATPLDAVADFVAAVKPRALHLLGLGASNKNAEPLAQRLYELHPELDLLLDSVLIRSMVGRTNGPGGGPRALTKALDAAEDELSGYYWGCPPDADDNMHGGLVDYTDCVVEEVATWLNRAGRKRVAVVMGYEGDELKRWLKDPQGFYQDNGNDWLDSALDAEWAARSKKASGSERKRRSVKLALGN
jgi:hypothetical protein